MEIFKLFGRILVEDDASESLAKVDDKAKGTGVSLGGMIGTAAKMGTAIAAAGAAAAGGLFALANKVSESTSKINDMSVRTGLSTDRLQELQYAAGQAGVNFDTVQNAAMKMQKSMGAATDTTKGMGLAFSRLGVSTKDSKGNLLSSQAVFDQTLQKLAAMTNESERNALGMKIFGGSFSEIQPLVAGGADGLAKMSAEAHSLGLVLGKDAIDAGDQFGDTLDKMQQMFGGVVNKIGVELMPMFQSLMDWVSAHMPEIEAVIKTSVDVVSVAIDILGVVIGTVIDAVKDLTKYFEENWAVIEPILIGLGAGAAVFGLYSLAINAAAIATGIWTTVTTIATAAATAFGAVMAFVTSPIGIVVLAIAAVVAVGVLLYKNWDTVTKYAKIAWGGIKNAIRGPVNGILGFINGVIGATEKMINGFVKVINLIPSIKIPKWVPGFGGKEFKIPKMPTVNLGKIPMLAQGGVVNEPTLAMVGEQGKEAVMPLENNTQWIDQLASKLNGSMGQGDIVIQVGELEIARVALNGINRLQRQSGRTLLTI
jgi:hypothetical protein